MEEAAPDAVRRKLVELASDRPGTQARAEAWFLDRGQASAPDLVRGLEIEGLGSVAHWRILLLLRRLALPETLPAIRSALRRALERPDPIVYPGAMEALAAFRAPEAVAEMTALLDAEDADVVKHAAVLLGGMGGPSSAGPLARLLGREETGVRYAAAQGLLQLGAPEARSILARHLASETDPEVRRLIEDAGIAGEGG